MLLPLKKLSNTVLVTLQNVLIHIFKVVINWFSAGCHNNNSAVCQECDVMQPLSLFSKTRASQNPYAFNERLFAHAKHPVVVLCCCNCYCNIMNCDDPCMKTGKSYFTLAKSCYICSSCNANISPRDKALGAMFKHVLEKSNKDMLKLTSRGTISTSFLFIMYGTFSLWSDLQRSVCNLVSLSAAVLFNSISCFSEWVRGLHEGFNKSFV